LTNETAALARLKDPAFDLASTVVLSASPGPVSGIATNIPATATITRWSPTRSVIQTDSAAPGVLQLNERWHPDWKVTVDGHPTELLRANFAMRGVAVPAGPHTVEFSYHPGMKMLWVTLSALMVALALGIGLGRARDESVKS